MAVLHISEADLARDVHAVLDRVQSGAEVIVERNAQPIAVMRAAEPRRRKLSEIAAKLGDTEATLSVVTVTELAHGIERADSATRRTTRLTQELRISSPDLMAEIEVLEKRMGDLQDLQDTIATKINARRRDFGIRAWWGFVAAGVLAG
jgi:antitoxin (DNA-binding transcriptional repressor) of toxin-antitoxin stability system